MNDLIQSRSALNIIQSIPECKSGKIHVPSSKSEIQIFSDPDLSPKPLQIDESKIEQIVNTTGKHKQNMFMI